MSHSSCVLGQSLYVFGGEYPLFAKTVEMLYLSAAVTSYFDSGVFGREW